jgi:hypothetical protein
VGGGGGGGEERRREEEVEEKEKEEETEEEEEEEEEEEGAPKLLSCTRGARPTASPSSARAPPGIGERLLPSSGLASRNGSRPSRNASPRAMCSEPEIHRVDP